MSTVEERQSQDKKVFFTKEDLLKYWTLEQAIQRESEEIINLQSKATRTTSSFSDSPKGQTSNDTAEKIYTELIEKKTAYYEKRLVAEKTRNAILKYISDIDDAKTRLILLMRYLDFLTWSKVARKIGGNNTADSIKRTIDRFFKLS